MQWHILSPVSDKEKGCQLVHHHNYVVNVYRLITVKFKKN